MANMRTNERVYGYDGIWMNEEDKSASKPLANNNCFHVDVQEGGHHEMNGGARKKKHLMQKQWAALKNKMGGGNGH